MEVVDLYEPLYKFDPEVVDLARKIPEIQDILRYLTLRKIPILRSFTVPGARLLMDYYSKSLEIVINAFAKPIDILGYLVHEYYHVVLTTIGSHEMYRSKNFFLTYMLDQETECFTKQAEFLVRYGTLAKLNSDNLGIIFSYKKGTLFQTIRLSDFDGAGRYIDSLDRTYNKMVNYVRNLPNWIINDARIPSCA